MNMEENFQINSKGKPATMTPIPCGGSSRQYFRLKDEEGYSEILTCCEDPLTNETFVKLAAAFKKHSVRVPQIYGKSNDLKNIYQEDLGETSLFVLLREPGAIEMCKAALDELVKLQTIDSKDWKDKLMTEAFGKRQIVWDLNYFKYCFLKILDIPFDEKKLEDDFETFTKDILDSDSPQGFMYRDFQSRNVMMKDGKPVLIDFQGGMEGPLVYDAVSFIWQAKAAFSDEEKEELKKHYVENLSKVTGIESDEISGAFNLFAFFRTLQVLGAYGYRGLIQQKKHFIESIPAAKTNLRKLLLTGMADRYPELKKACEYIIEEKTDESNKARQNDQKEKDSKELNLQGKGPAGLTVYVRSFSYKNGGYPESVDNNGGGFVFDCRGMHNPGRYEEYRSLTGRDKEVINFLEEKGEIKTFVEDAFRIVRPVVDRYLERGFTSLQVSFGCTGGRHRSMRSADLFADRLRRAYPEIKVELKHREFPEI